tara:strand:- start:1399 stop:2469 length:1071 start_codon:yes stop_codon:yes gene_type:complete
MKIALLGDINSSHTQKWVHGLKDIGHEIHLITLNPPIREYSDIDYTSLNTNVSNSNGNGSKLGYFLVIRKLRATIKRINPQIVHAHFASSYGMLALFCGHRPYYVSLWGSDIMEFPLRSPLHNFLLRQILSRAKHVFATSNIMAKLCENNYGVKGIVIPFGVNLEDFSPEAQNNVNPELRIGTIKRLEHIYGIDVLINAFASAKSQSSKNMSLIIAGDGSCLEEYKAQVKRLNIQDSVDFVGQIPHSKVPELLNTFDIFANLSRRESFGVSVIEASACGVATLVSDIEGLSEVCQDRITGLVVEQNNVSNTAEAMIELIDNIELRQKLGKAGAAFVRVRFDWKKNVNDLDKYYTSD